MPLPVGAIWTFSGNNFTGNLRISVDSAGNVSGHLNVGEVFSEILGFWDERSQKVTFIRKSSDPSHIQVYTACFFQEGLASDPIYRLTGFFEAFQGTGAVAQRGVYGWIATISGHTL
jgi:hypothetical protein